jgi:CRP-like cAMP-binding protein
MDATELRTVLLSHSVCKGLTPDEVDAIAQLGTRHQASKDADLFTEGETADSMIVLLSGEVVVMKKDMHSKEHELAKLQPGAIIGESSLVASLKRSATVRATQPVRYFAIPEAQFEKLLASGNTAAIKMVMAIARTLAVRQHQTNDQLMQLLDEQRETAPKLDLSRFRQKFFHSMSYAG